jgi:hypothetical protein
MTMPTPHVPGLEQHVADLERRIRALEGARSHQPAGSAVAVGAWPYNNADTSLWPRAVGTDWVQLYRWAAVMEWTTYDLWAYVVNAGGTGQLRVMMNNTVTFWTGPIQGSGELQTTIDLAARVARASFKGSTQQFALEGRLVTGTGPMYVTLERLLLKGPVD